MQWSKNPFSYTNEDRLQKIYKKFVFFLYLCIKKFTKFAYENTLRLWFC